MPHVSVGIDHNRSRDINIDEGSFPNFQFIETTDRDASFDVSLTWDLGELIWNDDQTSIDTRSKLMVELRDDILNEVTHLYFERRRLQVQIALQPDTDPAVAIERDIKLQELTAGIDALTGGYLSRSLERQGVHNPF